MAIVFIPIGMRSLTGGQRTVVADGRTVAEVVQDLEARFPGFHESLVESGRLRRGLTVAVNSVEQPLGLLAKVPEDAEVHILPAMAGGVCLRDATPCAAVSHGRRQYPVRQRAPQTSERSNTRLSRGVLHDD